MPQQDHDNQELVPSVTYCLEPKPSSRQCWISTLSLSMDKFVSTVVVSLLVNVSLTVTK